MFKNALFITAILFLASLIYLLGECQFLVPYRDLLLQNYGGVIAAYLAVLFVNVFAAIFWIGKVLFLSDTGRKLAHIEKQVRENGGIAQEIARMQDNAS